MKYKTFRNSVLTGAVALVIGGPIYLYYSGSAKVDVDGESAMPEPEVAAAAATTTPSPAGDPAAGLNAAPPPSPGAPGTQAAQASQASQTSGATSELRDLDRQVLKLSETSITGDKVKDALKSVPFKVNLYSDEPSGRVSRLKIDLNRNEKWDEKWSFETLDGRRLVKRQVSPADDDTNYPEKYRLSNDRWVRE